MSQLAENVSKRLFSLDVFRGLTMFLLIAEAAGFHHNFSEWAEGTAFSGLAVNCTTTLGTVSAFGTSYSLFLCSSSGWPCLFPYESDWPGAIENR